MARDGSFHCELEKSKDKDGNGNQVTTIKCHGELVSDTAGEIKELVRQTGAQLRKHLAVHRTNGLQYDVASNPEFLREGSAVEDFLHPDRIVVGVDSKQAAQLLREIYEPIIQKTFTCPVHSHCPVRADARFLVTDTNSAELIKHASNSFLAMKISFINMVANLCEVVGADVTKVAEGMGLEDAATNEALPAEKDMMSGHLAT